MSDIIEPVTGDLITPTLGDETDVMTASSEAVGALLDRSGQQLLAQDLLARHLSF